MAKGRKTGGRTKGVPNRVTTHMREELALSGLTPLPYMFALLRDPNAPRGGAIGRPRNPRRIAIPGSRRRN
jgi:hypothetical protein